MEQTPCLVVIAATVTLAQTSLVTSNFIHIDMLIDHLKHIKNNSAHGLTQSQDFWSIQAKTLCETVHNNWCLL